MSEKRAAIIGVEEGQRRGRANTTINALARPGVAGITSMRWLARAPATRA